MFKTKRISCAVSKVQFHTDGDTKELRATLHLNLTPALTDELSPRLKDRMFLFDQDEQKLVAERTIDDLSLNIYPKTQHMYMHSMPEEGMVENDAVKIEHVSLSNLSATRIGQEFRLSVLSSFERTAATLNLMTVYHTKTFFVTFEEVQIEQPLEPVNDAAVTTSLQDAADGELVEHGDGKSAGAGDGRRRRSRKPTEDPAPAA